MFFASSSVEESFNLFNATSGEEVGLAMGKLSCREERVGVDNSATIGVPIFQSLKGVITTAEGVTTVAVFVGLMMA